MSHDVPDFELENEDYNIPSTSTLAKHSADDEIMELLWQNNAPVAVNMSSNQSQSSKSLASSSKVGVTVPPSMPPLNPPPSATNNQLYMVEDEMSSWLHYPIEEFYNEFLYTNPNTSVLPPTAVIRPPDHRLPPPENHQLPPPSPGSWPENHPPMPPQPPSARWSIPPTRGFPLFSRMVGSRAVEPPLPRLMSLSTVVDSNDTPISSSGTATLAASCPMESVVVTSSTPKPIPSVRQSLEIEEGGKDESKTSTSSSSANNSSTVGAAVTTQSETGMRTVTSEVVHGKRKSREVEESFTTTTTATTTVNTHTEEVEPESGDGRKHVRGSSSSKRTRAAEVHNLSERRRRDRINEKIKALQELIPHCDKTDKASMLEEAIEYMKSLQMQVQIMSMGCGMMPMMYPRMQQQYMPPPMGMGMGLGMRMDLGMTRPLVPYAPAMPPPPASPAPPAANMVSPLAAGMPVTHYAVPLVPSPQLSVNQPNIPADPSGSSYIVPTPGMTPIVHMPNSYQQYLAYQQMQMQAGQSQTFSQPGSSKPDASKSEGDNDNNDDAQFK